MQTTYPGRRTSDDEIVLRGTLDGLRPGSTMLIESTALRATKRMMREEPGRYTLAYHEHRFYRVTRTTA